MLKASEKQEEVKPEITVLGFDDWRKALPATVEIDEEFADYFDLGKVDTIDTEDYLKKLTEVNDGHSYERGAIAELLDCGYELDELIVECSIHPKWGKMTWLKEHPAYERFWKERDNKDRDTIKMNFRRAMFMTEHAGEQEFTLESVSLNAAGLHKSLIYHNVVLSKKI